LGRFKQYIALEASYSYDHLFHSIFQGTITCNIPFGKKLKREGKKCSRQKDLLLSRAAFSPNRFEIPVVKKISRKTRAINPATDEPWNVWFVNNTSSSDGTFESPFSTLLAAQNASGANDMIYVFPGNGTSSGMNQGITLKNGQMLFGSAIKHQIHTTKGKIEIPPHSQQSPTIANTLGNIVTLASRNEVSGFNITATFFGSYGIIGGPGINGGIISNNFISGTVDHKAISVTAHGKFKILNNQAIASGINASESISLLTDAGTFMEGTLSNNSVSGYATGITFGPPAPSSNIASATIKVTGNSITNFQSQGIVQTMGYINGEVRVTNNTLNNNVGIDGSSGISVALMNTLSPLNLGQLTIDNNNVLTTTTSINTVGINNELLGAGFLSLISDISNNQITTGIGTNSSGINIFANTNNSLCASIINNQVTLQTLTNTKGIAINAATTGVVNVDSFLSNTESNLSISGPVNFIPEGTCNP
jgi:hypothetical protein